ncbi:PqqD family protein [Bacillus cereus]|uniref:PqqD family protein n=1 Tax=Bacillus TaxID=1386 RepID=UPI0024BC4BBD|nr:PqqD family protein [Bacillus cereus]MDR4154448.1 PqqD family protein [Bacillus cereus]MEB9935057.1 PqqD family protein [Bacillus cereus]MEB9955795.1 PqqD family protein [Bacillus cereus]
MNLLMNKELIVYKENNEIVLLNMIRNNFYTLDYVGSIIWNKIEELSNLEKVINAVSEEFDEEEDVIKDEILEFVLNLQNIDAIEINGSI